ncbi:hypothetical protein PIB30_066433 [Stylosanthes scabra]|uniref:CCHC-type domain-containing protein n=1 Tax=Stylosanthes scabra TaxID=79078 RepID=A0ABU6XME8_9FABA|nr:hypothetical protein [Stylosanthes scabra]
MQVAAVNTQIGACDLCGNLGHSREECALAQPVMEQANYMGNAPRPPYNDPYSKTFNPGSRNHPNFGWGNQGNKGQKHYNNLQQQQAPPMQPNAPQKPSELEIAHQKLSQLTSSFVDQTQSFMQETRANFKNQETSVRNLEVQVGQIAKQLSERPPNTLLMPKILLEFGLSTGKCTGSYQVIKRNSKLGQQAIIDGKINNNEDNPRIWRYSPTQKPNPIITFFSCK